MVVEDSHAYYASQAAYSKGGEYHTKLANLGYGKDESLSSHYYSTYTGHHGTIVSYKGTNPLDPTDVNADAAIAVGLHNYNSEFKKAKDVAKKAKEKYGEITTTGHSLGGTKAIESANATGSKSIVFNPGTGLGGLKTGDHKVYIKDSDPISSRVKGANVHKSKGGHSLNGFDNQFKNGPYMGVTKKRKRKGYGV